MRKIKNLLSSLIINNMSTWIQSLKKYHEEKGTKYKIPKKGSEEYTIILKFHNDIKVSGKPLTNPTDAGVLSSSTKKVRVKKEKVSGKPLTNPTDAGVLSSSTKKVKKVRVKKEKVPKVIVEEDVEVELVQEE